MIHTEIRQIELVVGSLLHDFGKLLYRYNDTRDHSTSGYDYLKKIPLLEGHNELLNCIRYHHADSLKNAVIADTSLCYITYIADNIAAAADRRKKENPQFGFIRDTASESVFNILNGNNEHLQYKPRVLSINEINYPTDDNITFDENFYSRIIDNITDSLKGIELSSDHINSLLSIEHFNLSFVPSSTNIGELRDISLYEHQKLTTAFASCILAYCEEKRITDYKTELFKNAENFYSQKAFRLLSLDISGIQNFIYNISGEHALKHLRARSFYLELLLEDIVDDILLELELSRANVMYTGGGHTYIIVPATQKSKDIIDSFEQKLNLWFSDNFGTDLYAAFGYADCSKNDLCNTPDGSYGNIYKNVSISISKRKLHRYSYNQIQGLNKNHEGERECNLCLRSGITENGVCAFCTGLIDIASKIIDNDDVFFVVIEGEKGVVLPFGRALITSNKDGLRNIINREGYIRAYSRNKGYTGVRLENDLYVGCYASNNEFSNLSASSTGIKRLGVIRADVDNLGQAFVRGFSNGEYETITRTSVLSAKLSEFFKLHINELLRKGTYSLPGSDKHTSRNAVIIYSGGDDLFVVGAWDDIICFAVDLYNEFGRFTQNTLSISAGIGLFDSKYPIYSMAEYTGTLETEAKKVDGKRSIALFDKSDVFSWDELINDILGTKLKALQKYVGVSEHGKAMLYNILELIRPVDNNNKELKRLNISRFAYLLAKLEPDEEANDKLKEGYLEFAHDMYSWVRNEKHCKQLITAIYIFIYMQRGNEYET